MKDEESLEHAIKIAVVLWGDQSKMTLRGGFAIRESARNSERVVGKGINRLPELL